MYFSENETDILSFCEENDVKFIRLTFCDTFGNMRNIAIMPRELHHAIKYGIPFNATGVLESAHQNLLLKPDTATLSILPWRPQSGRVVRFFCTLHTMNGAPYTGDVRRGLLATENAIREKGYTCEMGTRCEFYLFKTDIDGAPTLTPCDNGGYLDVAPRDGCENTRREICLSLEEMGINPTTSCHKNGPGQNEIDFSGGDPVTAADNMLHYKTVVKTIAAQNGQYASFMPKPFPEHSGSAMKITLCMARDNKSIFGDSRAEMTDAGSAFIAGILHRVRDFTLFANPTVNSYDRLGLSTAPHHINWSEENRTPLVQLFYAPGRQTCLEFRAADAYCNPYITFQMLLAAGMAGIQNKESLTTDMDAACENATFATLPASLEEAMDAAKASAFVHETLPENVINGFLMAAGEQIDACEKAGNSQVFCHERYF